MAQAEFSGFSVHTRAAIYEFFEINRLCEGHGTEGRVAIENLRNTFLEFSRQEHNILPHESTNVKKSELEESKRSKLLPRNDYL